MKIKQSVFKKIIILILTLYLPILALYIYNQQTAISLLENKLRQENLQNLARLNRDLNQISDQLSNFSVAFLSGPDALDFRYMTDVTNPANMRVYTALQSKLIAETAVLGSDVFFSLYAPNSKRILLSNTEYKYTAAYFESHLSSNWNSQKRIIELERFDGYKREDLCFYRQFTLSSEPYVNGYIVLESGFTEKTIQRILENHKTADNNPFFFAPGYELVVSRTSQSDLIMKLLELLGEVSGTGTQEITLDGIQYLVSYSDDNNIGGIFFDYIQMSSILAPVTANRTLFYTTAALLISFCIIAAVLMYRQVQKPIRTLINAVGNLKKGDFNVRVQLGQSSEFSYLFDSFNEMVEKIDSLIHNVYEEQLRAQKATLKQLQAQINPHFLYNCLFFIKNMARMGNEEAVVEMALHLGEYFRYTTRIDQDYTTLGKEIGLVEHYLKIMQMRTPRLTYHCRVDSRLHEQVMPRLILQPVVENAVIHGIVPNLNSSTLWIEGCVTERGFMLTIEDDSGVMRKEDIVTLCAAVEGDMPGEQSCGLWNVAHRLKSWYGPNAGLSFEVGMQGGLKVTMVMKSDNDAIPSQNQA